MDKDTKKSGISGSLYSESMAILCTHTSELEAKRKIPIPTHLLPFYGDAETAIFVTQLIYWQDRATKTNGWVAKTYEEWEAETNIKRSSLIRRVKALNALYLEKKPKMFNGKKRTHLRINKERYFYELTKYLKSIK